MVEAEAAADRWKIRAPSDLISGKSNLEEEMTVRQVGRLEQHLTRPVCNQLFRGDSGENAGNLMKKYGGKKMKDFWCIFVYCGV